MFNNSSEKNLKASLQGSFQRDVAIGKCNMQWTSMHDFEVWMQNERSPQVIKMARSNSDLNLFLLGNRLSQTGPVMFVTYT